MSSLSMWRWRVAATVLVAVTLALATAGSAGAAWTVRGAGGGAAKADVLPPPANVDSACGLLNVGGFSLKVDWSKPVGVRIAADRYLIERSTNGGATWTVAGQVLGSAVSTAGTIFEDVGLSLLATYHYRVTAVKGNWRRSVVAPPRTVVLGLLGLVTVCT
jgi:hypothetical protein